MASLWTSGRGKLTSESTEQGKFFISDGELIDAYNIVTEKFPELETIFKLMVYSGVRLKQIIEALKTFNPKNVVEVNKKVVRYPIVSTFKGKKKAFWMYFLASLNLHRSEISYHVARAKLNLGRVSANTIRKWNYKNYSKTWLILFRVDLRLLAEAVITLRKRNKLMSGIHESSTSSPL